MTTTADAPTYTGYWTDEGNYADDFAGGTGTESDPYLISTAAQLAYLAYQVNFGGYNYADTYFLQTVNIDLSAYYWDAIGTLSYYFRGHYDGGGYTISGLFTPAGSSSTYSYQGLFGYVRGTSSSSRATIENVNADGYIQGYLYVAGIVGYAYYYVTISNCSFLGEVSASSYVAGIVGYAYYADISGCYNTNSVTGVYDSFGGIAGYISYSNLYNCYNRGNVTTTWGEYYLGGIVGYIERSYVYKCYNTGSVSGGNFYVGGVVGSGSSSSYIYNCYNTGSVTNLYGNYAAGILGNGSGTTVSNCYYNNSNLSGIADGGGSGTTYNSALTTNAKTESWYTNSSNWNNSYLWDFSNDWIIISSMNDGYPILRWQVTYDNQYYYRDSNGNLTSTTQSRTYSTSFITLSSVSGIYSSNGWSLAGWATSNSSTSATYSAGAEVSDYNSTTGDLSFYAIASRTITLTYDANAGSDAVSNLPSSQSATQNWNMYGGTMSTYSLTVDSTQPTRTGYTFQGWSTDSSATTVSYGSGATVNFDYNSSESVTLYAVWIQNTVYYYRDSSGNLTSTTQERTYGTNFTTLSSVSGIYSSNGWNLIGWATGSSATSETYGLGESVSAYNSSASQVVLYAIASRMITIIYDGNGGTYSGSNTTGTQYWNMGDSTVSTVDLTITYSEPTRANYTFLGWSINSSDITATYFANGKYSFSNDYSDSESVTLYAVWEANVYTITLNHENGDDSTTIYEKYATGFYSTSAATSESEITSVTLPTRSGYSFQGYYTERNGMGNLIIDKEGKIEISNTYLNDDNKELNLYAYWILAAYQENDYWYIEYGSVPQTKVTDSTTITALDSATTGGGTYYFAGESYTAVVYNDNEYCKILGNWYLVEPIRWIIYSGNELTSGNVVKIASGDNIYMVTASVVDVGAFADSCVEPDSGYSTTNSYVTNFQKNLSESDLVYFSKYLQIFGDNGITTSTTSTSAYIFLSSAEEIQNALGTMSTTFSDLVLDYLSSVGSATYYFTRDLGTNLNNVYVYSRAGSQTQKLATSVYGMRFTVKFTEFVCVE